MTGTMIVLMLLGVAAAAVVGRRTSGALVRVRAERRRVWERDRADWRRWISRP